MAASMRQHSIPLLSIAALLFWLMAWPAVASVNAMAVNRPSRSLTPPSTSCITSAPTMTQWVRRDGDNGKGNGNNNGQGVLRDAHGRPIILNITTVIIAASPDPNQAYHAMANNTLASYQQDPNNNNNQNNGNLSSADPNDNGDGSLEKQLHSDQQALKRMVTILSLVGGLGVIAVVATIVIFTRMRIRKRKKLEMRNDSQEDEEDDNHSYTDGDRASRRSNSSLSHESADAEQHNATAFGHLPSAPTAPALALAGPIMDNYPSPNRHRHIVSMNSQTTSAPAPAPSAPTAKELDAMVLDEGGERCPLRRAALMKPEPTESPSESAGEESGTNSADAACPHCDHTALPPPELPPPAYTPSAPPMYALPPQSTEPDNPDAPSQPSSAASSSQLLPREPHAHS